MIGPYCKCWMCGCYFTQAEEDDPIDICLDCWLGEKLRYGY